MTYVDGLLGQVVDKDRARLHSELANECTAKEITSRREIRENRQKNGDE
jgi:hypothetical protein